MVLISAMITTELGSSWCALQNWWWEQPTYVSSGSFATEMGCPRYVRFAPDSDRRTDITARLQPSPLTVSAMECRQQAGDRFRLNHQPLKVGWRGCTQSLKSANSFHAGSGGSQPDRGA